ncbi:MAG: PhzF family phenazine biosynthesis protein [Myxococcales bacterium]|nr:PhzF family phenazine biosynthesis protein [Myxococcales bacterium]
MRHAFRILNVFTVEGDRLSGNPLCVFEDARELGEADMQKLARQLNLSETTFILPPTREGATARVRIFTPGYEMPFAGHPTLGTAHVVRALGGSSSLVLETNAGNVPVTAEGDMWTLRTARPPTTRKVAASRAELAQMLSLPDDAVCDEPLWVNTGVEQLVIPIRSPAHVRAAKPVVALIERHGYSETRQEAMAYLWARDGATIVVRFFFTQQGAVIEDPATGSACANLGGFLLATGNPVPIAATLSQGEAIGRPSQLGLRVDADRSIYVTGSVIELGRGTLEL